MYDHMTLRLHSYNCDLRPMELVWAKVKGYTTFNNEGSEFSLKLFAGINKNQKLSSY